MHKRLLTLMVDTPYTDNEMWMDLKFTWNRKGEDNDFSTETLNKHSMGTIVSMHFYKLPWKDIQDTREHLVLHVDFITSTFRKLKLLILTKAYVIDSLNLFATTWEHTVEFTPRKPVYSVSLSVQSILYSLSVINKCGNTSGYLKVQRKTCMNKEFCFYKKYLHKSPQYSKQYKLNFSRPENPHRHLYHYVLYNSTYIMRGQTLLCWTEAFRLCRDEGGSLPIINSRYEQEEIMSMLKLYTQSPYLNVTFLGLLYSKVRINGYLMYTIINVLNILLHR